VGSIDRTRLFVRRALILRHAGGCHIARMRVGLGEGRVTALQAQYGGLVLFAGILLLIPGFITGAMALCTLLVAPWRTVRSAEQSARRDGVVDLAPEQWHHVADLYLAKSGLGSMSIASSKSERRELFLPAFPSVPTHSILVPPWALC
jgi:hypothetical protein